MPDAIGDKRVDHMEAREKQQGDSASAAFLSANSRESRRGSKNKKKKTEYDGHYARFRGVLRRKVLSRDWPQKVVYRS